MSNQSEITLKPDEKKRKNITKITISSESTDGTTKVFRFDSNTVLIILIVVCVIIGGLIGAVIFEKQLDGSYKKQIAENESEITALNAANSNLNMEIESLNNKVRILSDTVNAKTENEAILTEVLDSQWLPKDFPLTGSATIIQSDSEEPLIILKSSDGATVVSTASGYVEDVAEDDNYGNLVIINHENGYKSYYRNKGQVMVKKGDDVVTGTTLYIIGSGNERLCYQISLDDVFIEPLEMLDING